MITHATRAERLSAWGAAILGLLVIAEFALAFASGRYVVDDPVTVLRELPFLVVLAWTLAVGWLLAVRRPGNPVGWMLMTVPGLFGLVVPVGLLGVALLDSAPTAAAWLLWYGGDREDTWAWIPPVMLLLTQIPLFFPDGQLPTRRWRPFWWFTIAAIVVACVAVSTSSGEVHPGVANPMPELPINQLWLALVIFGGLLATSFIGSISSLFVRYHRADDVERHQLRWVLWGVGVAIGSLLITWLMPWNVPVVNQVVVLTYGFIPGSIAVAVLRYRLFSIDRILSRTVSYAAVTLLTVAVYLVIVLSITALIPQAPAVAVAVATLTAAALFLPLLRRFRRVVDRRFDRERYDAQKVVDDFGQGLRAQVDPTTTSGDLRTAVERTLQPTAVGVWTMERRS